MSYIGRTIFLSRLPGISSLLRFYGSFFAATGLPIGINCLWQKLFDAFKALSKFLTYSVFSVLHIRPVSSPSPIQNSWPRHCS